MAYAFPIHGGDEGTAKATGKGDAASVTYRVNEASTKAEALLAVHAIKANALTQDGVILVYDSIKPKHLEAYAWEVTVEYINPDAQDPEDTQNEGPSWSFDTTGGGTTHITHGYQVRAVYPQGADKNVHGGAIGFQSDTKGGIKVNGIDVGIAGLEFSLTVRVPMPANPAELARQVARNSYKTNSGAWYGFDPGEVLFKGMRLSGKVGEKWELQYLFTASENITAADNFTIENCGTIEKRGFDYLDIEWMPTIDETNARPSAKPRYAFVHQIYREFSFQSLGIGG